MSGPDFHNIIATRERLTFVIDHGPAHLRPLYVAARDHGVRIATIEQRAGRFDPPTDKPVIAVLGDDVLLPLGPNGFHAASVKRFVARCGLVVVVSCDALPPLYGAAAACAALMRRNVLLIESQPRWEQDWVDLVKAANPGAQLLIGAVKPEGVVQ